jgi:hypothetical protein
MEDMAQSQKRMDCFKKLAQVRGFISLCQRQEINSLRGQELSRPDAGLLCGLCNGLEMERGGGKAQVRFRRRGPGADDEPEPASVDDDGWPEEQPTMTARALPNLTNRLV